MLIYISLASFTAGILMLAGLLFINFRRKKMMSDDLRDRIKEAKVQGGSFRSSYNKLYGIYLKIPVIRHLLINLERSLQMVGERDKMFLVKKSVTIISGMCFGVIILLSFFYHLTENLIYTSVFFFLIWYISDSYLDYFISRAHTKLLNQMLSYISDVRHMYYEYHVVDDAIYEATAKLARESREMAVQGEYIYDVLMASNQEEAMEKYLEEAPNPFLKMLMNFSVLTMEYGDSQVDGSSVFLMNLSFLSRNIQLELDKRQRLEYALKSMSFIVLIPLFMMSPVKEWAIHNFATLGKFYKSPLGQYAELMTLGIIVVSMILLNKIQNLDKISRQKMKFAWLVDRIPLSMNDSLKLKWFFGLIGFIGAITLIIGIQFGGRLELEHKVYYDDSFLGGNYSEEEIQRRVKESVDDYAFIKSSNPRVTIEEIGIYLEEFEASDKDRITRIQEKINLYHTYKLKWWHIIIAYLCGCLCYFLPEVNRYFDDKIKRLDIEDEIAGFQNIVLMLMYNSRMNVEEILEWMELYAFHFSQDIQECILNMASGQREALEKLKSRVANNDMERLVEQLILASEDISLKEAFDELAREKSHFFQKRKWENDKRVMRKIMLGQTIGFAPAYGMIVFYMILPMIISASRELNQFFEQIIQ